MTDSGDESVQRLINALLYEGSLLYPYRPSLKNTHPWTLCALLPPNYVKSSQHEAMMMQAECLLRGDEQTIVQARVHTLIAAQSEAGETGRKTDRVKGVSPAGPPWIEQTLASGKCAIMRLVDQPHRAEFKWPASTNDPVNPAIAGELAISAGRIDNDVFKLTVQLTNVTEFAVGAKTSRDDALRMALISPQILLNLHDGEFWSSLDPPASFRHVECRNVGCWPALVGEPTPARAMLCSPVILEDYPQVAPESAGDFFDATEMDEMLALRVMTLADHEATQLVAEGYARALLERTTNLSHEQWQRLHGALRHVRHVRHAPGDRVRLKPRGGADAFDTILAGKVATILSIERDFENRTYLAVTIDDDPGAIEGREGRIGHRFFYFPEEVEPLA